MKLASKHSKAQTILEMIFVAVVFSFFFGLAMFTYNIYEVTQKQVMLTRAQAMIELGNHSDFSGAEQGTDVPNEQQSQVFFAMGENSPGTRVDLEGVETFQEAIAGRLEIVNGGAENADPYWTRFRFPKFNTNVGTRIGWPSANITGDSDTTLDYELATYLAIAHNRSIELNNRNSENNVEEGMFSASVHFMDLARIADTPIDVLEGSLDNTLSVEVRLRQIAQADSSLSDEAERIRGSVNGTDGITGGAEAALIQLALSLAYQAAVSNLPVPEGFSSELADISGALNKASFAASAAGSIAAAAGTPIAGLNYAAAGLGAVGGLTSAFNNLGGSFQIGGSFLNNVAQVSNFSSQVLSTANFGFQIAGKNIEGLQIASQVTGVVGGLAGGIHGFQNATKNSQIFQSLSQLSGAGGAVFSLAGEDDIARGFGIASAGFGVAGAASNLSESWGETGWITEDGVRAWSDDGKWAATTSIGELIQQTGGFISQVDTGSTVGTAFSLAGGVVGTAGMTGQTAYNINNGKYESAFSAMVDIGAVVASGSAAGTQFASLTGNEKLAEAFAYGAIAGGAIGLVGVAGVVGADIRDGIKEWAAERKENREVKQAMKDLQDGKDIADPVLKQKAEARIHQDQQKAEKKAVDRAVRAIEKGRDREIAKLDAGVREKAEQVIQQKQEAKEVAQAIKAINKGDSELSKKFNEDVLGKANAQIQTEKAKEKIKDQRLAALEQQKTQLDQALENKKQELAVAAPEDQRKVLDELSKLENQKVDLAKNIEKTKYEDINKTLGNLAVANEVTKVGLTLASVFKAAQQDGAATAYQASGAEVFQANLAAQSQQSVQQVVTKQRENFTQLRDDLRTNLSFNDYIRVEPYFDPIDRMYEEYDKPPSERDMEVIREGQEALVEFQRISDELTGVPPIGSSERDDYIIRRIERNENILRRASREYQKTIEADAQIWAYVNIAETQLQDQRLLIRDSKERREILEVGGSVSKSIRAHREKYYAADNPVSYRLRKAEFSFERPRFVSPRQALQEIDQALKQRNRAVKNLRTLVSAHQQALH